MQGIIFLWCSWILWIVITFFLQKNNRRRWYAVIVLSMIIVNSWYIPIGHDRVSGVVLLYVITGTIFIAKGTKYIPLTFGAISICFGYVGILLWEKVSPVWIFMPRIMMLSLIGFILISFMTDKLEQRIGLLLLGTGAGEWIFTLIMNNYGFSDVIGDPTYLDFTTLTLMMFVITQYIKWVIYKLETTVKRISKRRVRVNHE